MLLLTGSRDYLSASQFFYRRTGKVKVSNCSFGFRIYQPSGVEYGGDFLGWGKRMEWPICSHPLLLLAATLRTRWIEVCSDSEFIDLWGLINESLD